MSQRSVKETAVLIVGHGTREPEGIRGFLDLVSSVQKQVRSHVQPAFLEITSPSILEGAEHCLSTGAERLLVIPLFLFGGQDVKKKLPRALEGVQTKYPQIAVALFPHLGPDRQILEILKERLGSAKRFSSPSETAVLLVARGFSDQDALAEMEEVRARFAQEAGFRVVEYAFVEIASPAIPDGISACLALQADPADESIYGTKEIVILPYLLFPGLMLKKIKTQAEAIQASRTGKIPIHVTDCLGPHPKLTGLLMERIQKGL